MVERQQKARPVFFSKLPARSHQSSLLDPLDHPQWSLFSNWLQSQDYKPLLLPVCCTLVVEQASSYSLCSLYQFDPSSSPSCFPSSCSDLGLFVDFSRGVFHSRLNTSHFSKSFSSFLHQADLLEFWPIVVWQSLVAVVLVSAARLSQPGWILVRYYSIVILTYLLPYLPTYLLHKFITEFQQDDKARTNKVKILLSAFHSTLSVIFHPCSLILIFLLLHFTALQSSPSNSIRAFSTPADSAFPHNCTLKHFWPFHGAVPTAPKLVNYWYSIDNYIQAKTLLKTRHTEHQTISHCTRFSPATDQPQQLENTRTVSRALKPQYLGSNQMNFSAMSALSLPICPPYRALAPSGVCVLGELTIRLTVWRSG